MISVQTCVLSRFRRVLSNVYFTTKSAWTQPRTSPPKFQVAYPARKFSLILQSQWGFTELMLRPRVANSPPSKIASEESKHAEIVPKRRFGYSAGQNQLATPPGRPRRDRSANPQSSQSAQMTLQEILRIESVSYFVMDLRQCRKFPSTVGFRPVDQAEKNR